MNVLEHYTLPPAIEAKMLRPLGGIVYDAGLLKEIDLESKVLWEWLIRDYKRKEGLQEEASEHFGRRISYKEMNEVEQKLYQIGQKLARAVGIIFPDEIQQNTDIVVVGVARAGWAIARGFADQMGVVCQFTQKDASQGNNRHTIDMRNIPSQSLVYIIDDAFYQGTAAKALAKTFAQRSDLKTRYCFAFVDVANAIQFNHPIVTFHKHA